MRSYRHLCGLSKYVDRFWLRMEVWKYLFYLLVNLQVLIWFFHFRTAFGVILTTHFIEIEETLLSNFVVYHCRSFPILQQTWPFWIALYCASFPTAFLLPLYFQLSKLHGSLADLLSYQLMSGSCCVGWHWTMCQVRAIYRLIGLREGYLKCLQKRWID